MILARKIIFILLIVITIFLSFSLSKKNKKRSTIEDLIRKQKENINEAIERQSIFNSLSGREVGSQIRDLLKPSCAKSSLSWGKNCKPFDAEKFSKRKSILNMNTNGRLGNQMSTFASLYGISKELGLELKIYSPQHKYLNYIFKKFNDSFLPLEEEICDPCSIPWEQFSYKKIKSNSSLLKGHAFSWSTYEQFPEMFRIYLNELREIFTFRDKIQNEASRRIKEALSIANKPKDSLLIGIHVRRTDMIGFVKLKSEGGKIVDKNYFDQVKKYFLDKYPNESVVFVIVGDSRKWIRKNLIDDNSIMTRVDVSHSTETEAGIDLAILSQCDHLILSHGTYGMWAGLLSKGEKITPEIVANIQMPEFEWIKKANISEWKIFSLKENRII